MINQTKVYLVQYKDSDILLPIKPIFKQVHVNSNLQNIHQEANSYGYLAITVLIFKFPLPLQYVNIGGLSNLHSEESTSYFLIHKKGTTVCK